MTRKEAHLRRLVAYTLKVIWDPIGCGVPSDEYTSYVAPVARSLRKPASEIVDLLGKIRTETIGLKPNRTHDRFTVRVLLQNLRRVEEIARIAACYGKSVYDTINGV